MFVVALVTGVKICCYGPYTLPFLQGYLLLISPVGGVPSACVSPLRAFSFRSSPPISLIFNRGHASMTMGWGQRRVGGFINIPK